ncbi:hypothetical protein F5Y06DRAFT_254630 [Hypoxylon sp. FL0890]|nr:hypothetical protein F5Y06DRAFT_254630 [Hypoxylon sp. FL0890]
MLSAAITVSLVTVVNCTYNHGSEWGRVLLNSAPEFRAGIMGHTEEICRSPPCFMSTLLYPIIFHCGCLYDRVF